MKSHEPFEQLRKFIASHQAKVAPLSKKLNSTYYNASLTGNAMEFEKASKLQMKINRIYSNKDDYKFLKKFRKTDISADRLLKRQYELIYNGYIANQFDEELHKKIIKLSNKVEELFSTFRAESNGRKYTDNEIDEILASSDNSNELEEVWKASKQIGQLTAKDVILLVKLRNKAARKLGFKNFHLMSLTLDEQNEKEIDSLFIRLDDLTRDKYEELKSEVDKHLAERFSIKPEELMPWHYGDKFFQSPPKIFSADIDKFFRNADLIAVSRGYYNGIGLEIDDILERSDLFERENKYQHAFCTDIDRDGDIRIVCNLINNQKWMGTLLHELGHAVYDKYISKELPWILRIQAHIFTTEAIAMLFGRFVQNPAWLGDMNIVTKREAAKIRSQSVRAMLLDQLVFCRWVQVMYRFEKEMYKDPDQDLNKLWWKLVEKYQKLKKPKDRNEPDWASKIHIALYPAYYHNYMLGELLASQLFFYITSKVLKTAKPSGESFAGKMNVGKYLKNSFFNYGALYHWKELIIKSTGEPLNPEYYAQQFINNTDFDDR